MGKQNRKNIGSPDHNSGGGYNKGSAPWQRKDNPPQPGVCEFCGYHRSHSPTCFENPKNK